MDSIILGVVKSTQPFKLKEAFLEKLSSAAAENENKDVCYGCINACLAILYPIEKSDDCLKDSLICDRVERLLISWMEGNLEFSVAFIQDNILIKKLVDVEMEWDGEWLKCRHIKVLLHLLKVLRGIMNDNYAKFKNVLGEYLFTEFFHVDNLNLLSYFSELFLQNPALVSGEVSFDVQIRLIHVIIKVVANNSSVTCNVKTQDKNISYIEPVVELFKKYIDNDINVMKHAAGLIFKEISNEISKPCPILACLLAQLRCDILRESLENSLLTVPDLSVASILIRLLDWLCIRDTKSNMDQWIMIVIEFLMKYEKFNILVPVVVSKINQICELVYDPLFRKQGNTILAFMLMCCNKTPNPFHKVLLSLPPLMDHLMKDGSESALLAHRTLVELIYTMMYNFPGYSELYAPLVTVLDGHKKPKDDVMKAWLTNFGSSREYGESVITMQHMHPVETGIRNLGNTCYMNSVIQALFNLLHVKARLLTTSYNKNLQNVSMNLQNVFAFLHLSKRLSIEPTEFLRISRPNWFRTGSQQDCSEYLKHLLDKLQQECPAETDKIDDVFNGEINATVECLQCHSCSHQKEVFNDLPLSFRNNINNTGKRDIGQNTSLKGGNSSDILDSKKVKFELPETSKENVSSLDTDNNMSDSDIMFPNNSDLSIIDLLNNYFLPELLQDTNKYFCNHCESLQDAYKSMKITKFPKYLILTLKRFTYNIYTKKRSKILDIIKYPDMFTICNGCDSCYQIIGASENSVLAFTSVTECQTSKKYRISSVIVHSGLTSDSGHYYCYSCCYGAEKHTWYLKNDEEVKLVSDDCILNLATDFSRDAPYVCIYEECEPHSELLIDLPQHLTDMVFTDNQLYLHEKLMKNKKSKNTLELRNPSGNRKDDDDDDNSHGPIGPCSSSGGNEWGGARFVC